MMWLCFSCKSLETMSTWSLRHHLLSTWRLVCALVSSSNLFLQVVSRTFSQSCKLFIPPICLSALFHLFYLSQFLSLLYCILCEPQCRRSWNIKSNKWFSHWNVSVIKEQVVCEKCVSCASDDFKSLLFCGFKNKMFPVMCSHNYLMFLMIYLCFWICTGSTWSMWEAN